MRGVIPPLPNTPSLRGAQLKKHRVNFTLAFTPGSKVRLDKLIVTQLLTKFSASYGTRRVAANIMNKLSRTAKKGWYSRLGFGKGLTISHRVRKQLVKKCPTWRRDV
jgi:hypothetical protein